MNRIGDKVRLDVVLCGVIVIVIDIGEVQTDRQTDKQTGQTSGRINRHTSKQAKTDRRADFKMNKLKMNKRNLKLFSSV